MKKTARWRSYAYLLLNAVVWGAAFVAVKPAFEITTPLRFLFYRHLLAALLCLPVLWHFRSWWPKIKPLLPKIIGLELLGSTLALSLLYEGLRRTTVIEASLLTLSLPFFITLGGIWLLQEKQERHEWIGMLIAMGGVAYVTVLPLLHHGQGTDLSLFANLLIIGSNIANLFYFPLAKKTYKGLPKFLITTISFWVATLSFLPLAIADAIYSHYQWLSVNGPYIGYYIPQPTWTIPFSIALELTQPAVLIAVGYMAIFGSIIGLTAYIKGQDGIESSEAGLFYYLQPLVYLPLTLLLLGETISIGQIGALITILAGVAIAQRRRW